MRETKCGFNTSPELNGAAALIAHGPTLLVDIGFDPNYAPTSTDAPALAETKLWALVDTGATESCIDNDLAKKLLLPVVDRRHVAGVGGRQEVNMYLAHIHVPALAFTLYGSFAGVDLIVGGQLHGSSAAQRDRDRAKPCVYTDVQQPDRGRLPAVQQLAAGG